MKVLLTKPFFKSDIDYIKSNLSEKVEIIQPANFTEDSITELAPDADVLFGAFFTDKLLGVAKSLKFIQVPWTGVDNLDFETLKKHQVTICNSHSNATIVAEHAVALMFDAAKKISYHDRLLRQGNWNRPKPDNSNEVSPFSRPISGSKVGIIGFGAIGKKVYQMLSGFSCQFKVFTKDPLGDYLKQPNINVFSPEEKEKNIAELDFVFIAIPLTNETKGSLNHTFFDSLSRKAIIINISRGAVFNEADLYTALANKTIAGAAIDTWYNYPNKENPITPPSKQHDFHLLNNVVLSPHRAGFIDGSFPHLDDAIENLNRLAEGKELINVISLEKKY